MPKMTEAQKRANRKYDTDHTIQIKFKLNKKTDADILDFFNNQINKQGTFKSIVRTAIANLQ